MNGWKLIFLLPFLSACGDGVTTYRATNDHKPAPAVASAQNARWRVPVGWIEQPPSEMRAASFLIKGKNGLSSDVSVIPLAGAAGGDLENINRWRGQIDLPPLSESELSRHVKTIDAGGRPMRYVNFASEGPLIDGRYKKRVAAAYYHDGERTWFVKMTGEDQNVRDAEKSFLQFLGSMR